MSDTAPTIVAPVARVKVEEIDFENATAQDQFKCAIVRAVQRQFPKAKRVRVNTRHIAWSVDEQRFVYDTPDIAIDAVIRPLDTGGKPEPVTLRLTNGYVKPVEHYDEDKLLALRQQDRANPFRASKRPQSNPSFARIVEDG